ncbi:UDP-N-acetylmuramoyl-L-alanyl-D-glutamate--2,6-diaminopimelate ligase [Virgibacillus salexigens]|uniref:UDP-N-acetylmuramoyl-L-alanyl-D-glutamate--2, 6-diaminopimelate ligase n=1 Tax=Virgibacillus salexigens TaxID=61016 RepID=UPI00190922F6|nr:UDP-N-acetylmuramoyl-L-alanyl-D-glutamate--2,6-diaminopimelate ligase [Virgibacillus salexigens]
MKTLELLENLHLKQIHGHLPECVNSIHQDSREVTNNSLFICISGHKQDGHDYYHDAINNGANIIVAEKQLEIDFNKSAFILVPDTKRAMAQLINKFHNYPSSQMTLFGVTGTNGKTTVTTLIQKLLQRCGIKSALAGTNGFQIDNKKYYTENTTSDVLTNQALLALSRDQHVRKVVMEVSSHGLAQGRLWGIDYDIAVFTNLSQDHLDYHQTMEAYGYVKGLLFAQLGNDMSKSKYAILNQDDPWSETYKMATSAEVITYGLQKNADFRAFAINYTINETTFTLEYPEGRVTIAINLLGEFNVYNTLAALAALYADGNDIKTMIHFLPEISNITGRMEKLVVNAPITMYVDYAHTPDAIEKCIKTVAPFKQKRIILVVGTGGERDREKRPLMAKKASHADVVILTVNDPRTEASDRIIRDMEKGMLHDDYLLISDRKQAIEQAIRISEPGDTIIFAGKGQENYQIIGETKHPHNDALIATEFANSKFQRNTD